MMHLHQCKTIHLSKTNVPQVTFCYTLKKKQILAPHSDGTHVALMKRTIRTQRLEGACLQISNWSTTSSISKCSLEISHTNLDVNCPVFTSKFALHFH